MLQYYKPGVSQYHTKPSITEHSEKRFHLIQITTEKAQTTIC